MKSNKDQELEVLKNKSKENSEVLQLLYSIASEISFNKDVDSLIEKVVARICEVMKTQDASLLLLNPETGLLDFRIIKGLNSQSMREINPHLKPGEGLAGWVFVNNQPAIANDVVKDPRFKQGLDWLTGFKTKNLLAVPVYTEGKSFGVLEVINRNKDEFTEEDAEFLTSIANLIATALKNAQMYKDLQLSQNYVQNILDHTYSGFIGIDLKNLITYHNNQATEILGLTGDIHKQNYKDVFKNHKDLTKTIEKTFSEKEGMARQSYETIITGKGKRIIGYSTFLISNQDSNLQGVGIIFQDITDFKTT